MNRICATGNMVADPDLKFLPKGTAICNFTVAINCGWGDNKSTLFLRCAIFGKSAETAAGRLKKGGRVAIDGRIKPDNWEKDGVKHERVQAVLDSWDDFTPKSEAKAEEAMTF